MRAEKLDGPGKERKDVCATRRVQSIPHVCVVPSGLSKWGGAEKVEAHRAGTRQALRAATGWGERERVMVVPARKEHMCRSTTRGMEGKGVPPKW